MFHVEHLTKEGQVNTFNKILFTLSVTFLLIVAAFLSFFILKEIQEKRNLYLVALHRNYENNNDISYLWQSLVLAPRKETLKEIEFDAVKKGNCETLRFTESLFRNNESRLSLLECFIENKKPITDRELRSLSINQENELNNFRWLSRGQEASNQKIEHPSTNIGMISTMIQRNDFRLFNPTTRLGIEISEKARRTQKDLELNLAVASVFLENDFPKITIYIIDKTIINNSCLLDAHRLKAKAQEALNQKNNSIESYQTILNCNPIDESALQRLIYLKTSLDQDASLYKKRLLELEKIK